MSEETDRILDQEQIDQILGFEENEEKHDNKGGIASILDSGMVSYERLPMLEVVCDRLLRLLSTSVRNFTSDNAEITLDGITSIRFGDYLNSIPLPAMINVFKAEDWDNFGLLIIDSQLVYSIVDVLLGGRRGSSTIRIEGRSYTTIERSLLERFVNIVLRDLSSAFEPISRVTFTYNRLETNPRFATIARQSNASVVARFVVDMEGRGGRLTLLFPYATLEPIRELLLQQFMGEKFGRDSIWESHMANKLWETEIDLKAVLDEVYTPIGDVVNWEEGSFLPLVAQPGDPVKVRSGDVSLFDGDVGQKDGKVSVKMQKRDGRLVKA